MTHGLPAITALPFLSFVSGLVLGTLAMLEAGVDGSGGVRTIPVPVLQDNSSQQERAVRPTPVHVYVVDPATTGASLARAVAVGGTTGAVQFFMIDDGAGDESDVAKQASIASGELMQMGHDYQILDLRGAEAKDE